MGKKGRSGNGEDSYTKLPSGKWRCQYWVCFADGTKKRRSKSAIRKGRLKRAVEEDRQRASGFGSAAVERMTVEDLIGTWMESVVRSKLAYRTVANYDKQIRNHILPELGDIRLTALTEDRIQSFCNSRTAAGLKPSTVHHILVVLRAALAYAVRKNYLKANPAEDISLPSIGSRKKSRILSSLEVEKFLSAAEDAGDRHLALYYVAFFCGLRIGEILGLEWRNVDFEAQELLVRHQIQRMKGRGLITVGPKRDEQRTVPFGVRVRDALVAHFERQRQQIASTPNYREGGLVFATMKGTHLDPQNVVNRGFKRVLKNSNLPPVNFHATRHSCATIMLKRGANVGAVSAILGHRDVATTLSFYGHIDLGMTRQAAEVFDNPT